MFNYLLTAGTDTPVRLGFFRLKRIGAWLIRIFARANASSYFRDRRADALRAARGRTCFHAVNARIIRPGAKWQRSSHTKPG